MIIYLCVGRMLFRVTAVDVCEFVASVYKLYLDMSIRFLYAFFKC